MSGDMQKLAKAVCEAEGGAEEVNIAQVLDVLAALADVRVADEALYESGLQAAYRGALERAGESAPDGGT